MSATFLCFENQLEEGSAKGFDPWGEGRDTVIALRWQGSVRAYRNLCPHLNVSMQYRKDRFMSGDRRHIVCFAHGALFRPESGECVLGPCLGQRLWSLPLSLDADRRVWISAEADVDRVNG